MTRLLKYIFSFDLFYYLSNDDSQEELPGLRRPDFRSGPQGNKGFSRGGKF